MPAASPSLRIWCNYDFNQSSVTELLTNASAHHLTFVDSSIPAPAADEPIPDILLGQPDADYLLTRRPRWAEITSAGYTHYDRDDLRRTFQARGAVLTNSSRVFDEACAQHLLAMLLGLARELPRCLENQRGERAWLHDEPRQGRRFLLNGQKVIIYGYGAIAHRLVELLRPLGLAMVGVRRVSRGDESIPIATESAADVHLAEADHVLNILPASDSTAHYFNAARFALCKRGAHFYNIGRGATVDQEALVAALQSGHLAAAYLDVTDPEPLPPEHGLWDAPNCLVTPHLAGTHDNEEARLVQHFLKNLAAFEAGQPMIDQVIPPLA